MEYECPRCECEFEVNFTNEEIDEPAEVNFCPYCGCETIYYK